MFFYNISNKCQVSVALETLLYTLHKYYTDKPISRYRNVNWASAMHTLPTFFFFFLKRSGSINYFFSCLNGVWFSHTDVLWYMCTLHHAIFYNARYNFFFNFTVLLKTLHLQHSTFKRSYIYTSLSVSLYHRPHFYSPTGLPLCTEVEA